MLDRDRKMRTKIMAYHRQFLEAREERRQAEFDAIGEQIFANANNWLRVPGQRRSEPRGSLYRVPTPHPRFRRRLDEPEPEEDESCEEEDDNDFYIYEKSPLDAGQSYRPRRPVQLQRCGGRRARHPLYRPGAAFPGDSSQDVEKQGGEELLSPYLGSDTVHRGEENHAHHSEVSEEPTPAQEIQAIVRSVQQRRQVVVIQPNFPYPNYSAGEIVDGDDYHANTRAANGMKHAVPGNGASTSSTSTLATQTNTALHYLNRPRRGIARNPKEHDGRSAPSRLDSSLPFPPGAAGHGSMYDEQEAPAFSLPSPALDLSSANLTGSLFAHPSGLSPGVLFRSARSFDVQRMYNDDAVMVVEHAGDVSREADLGVEESVAQHVENVSYAGYRHAGTSMTD